MTTMPPVRSELWDRLQSALGDAYRLERELVGGGMSRLFLAADRALDRMVVVKVLPPELAGDVSATRFQREVALTAHFQHPHILPILVAGAHEGLLYYIMPHVDGESLHQRIQRAGPLPFAEIVPLLAEIADALAYAHEQGVVHRDVKPSNILIAGGHAVLVDFGVAQAVAIAEMEAATDTRITRTGQYVGTTCYMAPEQFAGIPDVDARVDVFSLGVVIYESLTGQLPCAGDPSATPWAARVSATAKPLASVRRDVPRQLSDLVARALAFEPDARLRSAAELRDGLLTALAKPVRRWTPGRVAAFTTPVVAAAALLLWEPPSPPPALNDNLVVITPFEVIGEEHGVWREGIVDLLSANLDGAGPLVTVNAATAIRNWRGRFADSDSAVAFGRRLGARFVVLGRVIGAGPDSLRATAWLMDALTEHRGEQIDFTAHESRMGELVDTLTIRLLQEIGTVRPVSLVQRASVGSTNFPAVRAFLEGERHFRRTAWDSARAAYARAIALDSNFALAHAHMSLTYAWQRFGADSVSRVHALKAGALNHGLAPRESLLIAADSLRSVVYGYGRDPQYAPHVRRLFAILREANARYPLDAEARYRLADAYFHFALGRDLSVQLDEILRTFDEGIALDPAFAPAYIHPVELGFALGDSTRALDYARRYSRLRPTDVSAAGTLLAAQLIAGSARDTVLANSALDTASGDLLFQAYSAARRSLVGREAAIRILRLMATGRRADYAPLADPAFARHRLVLQLSYRGRFREAIRLDEALRTGTFAEMAMTGTLPDAHVRAVLAHWLRTDAREPGYGTPMLASAGAWWAGDGDTASLQEALGIGRRIRDNAATRAEAAIGTYSAALAHAYLALARRDTATALERFRAVPDSLCQLCAIPQLVHARVLAARNEPRAAQAILANRPTLLPSAIDVLWALDRGRIAERLGDSVVARTSYATVVSAWHAADAELAPLVDEARRGLARLPR